MSQKELKKYLVINSYIERTITRQKAAELLDLSTRQISRLKKGVVKSGPQALIHKNIGRKPTHAVSGKMKEDILKIHELSEFKNVNFPHFQDILDEKYKIKISYSSLSSILKNSGIESPKKKKIRKKHKTRSRKSHPGELVQIDATPFEWISSKGKYALHGVIDDATGKILGLFMTKNECLYGYLEIMRQCCLNFGVPQTIYSDNHTIFRSPKADKLTVEDIIKGKEVNLTQFGRAMYELGVDIIYAKSPQAKGRIERLWETLQSRLPVELAMRNITTVEEANVFLSKEFIDLFNEKFAVEAEKESIFVSLVNSDKIDNILCIKRERKTDNAGVFSFNSKAFQILDKGFPVISKNQSIDVLIGPRIGIRVGFKGKIYETIRYLRTTIKKQKKKATKKPTLKLNSYIPYSSDEWKKIWWFEDYNESLEFLYELFFKKQNKVS